MMKTGIGGGAKGFPPKGNSGRAFPGFLFFGILNQAAF